MIGIGPSEIVLNPLPNLQMLNIFDFKMHRLLKRACRYGATRGARAAGRVKGDSGRDHAGPAAQNLRRLAKLTAQSPPHTGPMRERQDAK